MSDDGGRHLSLVVPGLPGPRAAGGQWWEGLSLPALTRFLTLATPIPPLCSESALSGLLFGCFGVEREGPDWPAAAVTAGLDGAEPSGAAWWLRADPVHLRVDMGELVLVDTAHLGISTAEAGALCAEINAELGASGPHLQALDPQRWYLGLDGPRDLVTQPPWEVSGGAIGESQDPDQTYPSPDDDQGGVDKIDFTITDALFVRWTMNIPGDDDIDLFLEDSAGNIIAASTSGGTDELIELMLPANDTYTMVVHGWSVPNEPLPYTLHYWEVPMASGGSLSVDAAPTSAVVGETSAIDVSWSGLSAGTSYLGAVSHTGDAGLMGITLVNVDNP